MWGYWQFNNLIRNVARATSKSTCMNYVWSFYIFTDPRMFLNISLVGCIVESFVYTHTQTKVKQHHNFSKTLFWKLQNGIVGNRNQIFGILMYIVLLLLARIVMNNPVNQVFG